jgi:thymidylate synthase (FAD)
MANMCVEIETSRAISQQIVRHRSFSFQEMSQRYAEVPGFEVYPARRQDIKNRQNSFEDLNPNTQSWWESAVADINDHASIMYKHALARGIAKECARFLLPMSSKTLLCMNGTIRSWIHYLELRTDEATQKEHRDIALEIKTIFVGELPIVSRALGWSDS